MIKIVKNFMLAYRSRGATSATDLPPKIISISTSKPPNVSILALRLVDWLWGKILRRVCMGAVLFIHRTMSWSAVYTIIAG